MEFIDCIRRPFEVKAIEVTLQNVEQVAAWCRGTVGEAKVKMMGTETVLPCIELKGQGIKKNQTFVAQLGHFIVEHKGSFRVYRRQQFEQTFEKRAAATEMYERGIVTAEQCLMDLVEQGLVEERVAKMFLAGEILSDGTPVTRDDEDIAEQLELEALEQRTKPLPDDEPSNGHMEGLLQQSPVEKLKENDWIRVKNSGNMYYGRTGFVTVADVDVHGRNGAEIEFHDGHKAVFGYDEIEHYSVV